MIIGNRLCVVLPAFNAALTLQRTFAEIPIDVVDDIILVDDASTDETLKLAKELGIITIAHDHNKGYGANQKTCYRTALDRGADIVIMLHPDYQYTPKLILPMASLLASGFFDVVLGSRILGVGALAGGMPLYKYVANRMLTFTQNILLNYKLSEYHTGYRAYTRAVLEDIPLDNNPDDLPRLSGWRDFLSHPVFHRGIFYKLSPKHCLWRWRTSDCYRVSPGVLGVGARQRLRGLAATGASQSTGSTSSDAALKILHELTGGSTASALVLRRKDHHGAA